MSARVFLFKAAGEGRPEQTGQIVMIGPIR